METPKNCSVKINPIYLIQLIYNEPILYEQRFINKDTENESQKLTAWKRIAQTLNCTIADCMAQWTCLRRKFIYEKEREIEKQLINGGYFRDEMKSKWEFMDLMRFMENHITLTLNNLIQIPTRDDTSTQDDVEKNLEKNLMEFATDAMAISQSLNKLHEQEQEQEQKDNNSITNSLFLNENFSSKSIHSEIMNLNLNNNVCIASGGNEEMKISRSVSHSTQTAIDPVQSKNDGQINFRSSASNLHACELFGRFIATELSALQDDDLISRAQMLILKIIYRLKSNENVAIM